MARFADLFTGGGYSKALKERNKIADRNIGPSGYAKSRNEAMEKNRAAMDEENAQRMADLYAQGSPLGARMAAAVQGGPSNDYFSLYNDMNRKEVEGANKRVNQQLVDAKNAQEGLARGALTALGGIKNAIGLNLAGYKGMGKNDAVAAPDDSNALTPSEQRMVQEDPDALFNQDNTWKQVYNANKRAGLTDEQIAAKYDNSLFGKQGKRYQQWRGGIK